MSHKWCSQDVLKDQTASKRITVEFIASCRFSLWWSYIVCAPVFAYDNGSDSKMNLDESLEEVVLTDANHKLVVSLLAIWVITVHITWIPNRNAQPTNRSTSNLTLLLENKQRSFMRSPRWSARVPVVARNVLSSRISMFTGLSADPWQLHSSKSSMNTRSRSNPWHDMTINY